MMSGRSQARVVAVAASASPSPSVALGGYKPKISFRDPYVQHLADTLQVATSCLSGGVAVSSVTSGDLGSQELLEKCLITVLN